MTTQEVLSNYQAIELLKGLPGNNPFGRFNNDRDKELYKKLYTALQKTLGTTTRTSQVNAKTIKAIERLKVPLYDQFPLYRNDASQFWEGESQISSYSDRERGERVTAFLESTYKLKGDYERIRILKRFTDLVAFILFRRAIPGTNVHRKHVQKFLHLTGVPKTDKRKVGEFCEIIKRGQKVDEFCRNIQTSDQDSEDDQDNEDENDQEKYRIYAPLLFSFLPESIWSPRGLARADLIESAKHVKKLQNQSQKVFADTATMAKHLLSYQAELFVWVDNEVKLAKYHGAAHPNASRNENEENNSNSAPGNDERQMNAMAIIPRHSQPPESPTISMQCDFRVNGSHDVDAARILARMSQEIGNGSNDHEGNIQRIQKRKEILQVDNSDQGHQKRHRQVNTQQPADPSMIDSGQARDQRPMSILSDTPVETD